MNRVVITGMGIWSCIGTSLDEVRDALYAGKSGIILDPIRKEAGFRSGLVRQVSIWTIWNSTRWVSSMATTLP